MGANRIIGSIFFSDTVSSFQNITFILTLFFECVDKMGRWLKGNVEKCMGGEVQQIEGDMEKVDPCLSWPQ